MNLTAATLRLLTWNVPHARFGRRYRCVFGSPAPQAINPVVTGREIRNGDGDRTASVDRIGLLDLMRPRRRRMRYFRALRVMVTQGGIERKLDRVPQRDVAAR